MTRTARLLRASTAMALLSPLLTAAPALAQSATAQSPTGQSATTQAAPAAVPTYSMGAVTATADRTEKAAIDTTAPVSVRTSEELDRTMPSTVTDLLSGIPGVTAYQTAGQPGTKINIRGLQDFGRVNVMVDGARQNFQRSSHGQNTTVFIDPDLIGQVDVVRGPSAVVYGSGAIGGIVNFQTKDAKDLLRKGQTFGGQVTGIYGDNSAERRGAISGYAVADWADVVASVSGSDRGNFKGGDGKKVDASGWESTKIGRAHV